MRSLSSQEDDQNSLQDGELCVIAKSYKIAAHSNLVRTQADGGFNFSK